MDDRPPAKRIRLTIDSASIEAAEGSTVLAAALENGIYVPHLCHHPDLEPAGVCRLCLVDLAGKGIVVSCKTPVAEGMAVRTETPEIASIRRVIIELLLANHPWDCLSCGRNTDCKLQQAARHAGVDESRLKRLRRTDRVLPLDRSNPFFTRDPNKCVLCGVCVRTCASIQGTGAIDFIRRGFDTAVGTLGGKPIAESSCESCGECAARCPTGALSIKESEVPAREVKTVCPYCGCGCGVVLGVRMDRIVGVRGDRENPVNRGRLCVKGRFGHAFVRHKDRLRMPLLKRNGKFEEISWDDALDAAAAGFGMRRGDAFALLASAKSANEDAYAAQKFARSVMGSNNVDHCARL